MAVKQEVALQNEWDLLFDWFGWDDLTLSQSYLGEEDGLIAWTGQRELSLKLKQEPQYRQLCSCPVHLGLPRHEAVCALPQEHAAFHSQVRRGQIREGDAKEFMRSLEEPLQSGGECSSNRGTGETAFLLLSRSKNPSVGVCDPYESETPGLSCCWTNVSNYSRITPWQPLLTRLWVLY